jgi:hypothetical protein
LAVGVAVAAAARVLADTIGAVAGVVVVVEVFHPATRLGSSFLLVHQPLA